ncbi:MAG: hypothetical protein M1816_005603 [Peltula sp. TS41687]|nr:MAG: hypothetical protein M1816_005603 [Peltula sp. TS41687]
MHLQTLSILALFSATAFAGPWGITGSAKRGPFWWPDNEPKLLDGGLFHAFRTDKADPNLVYLWGMVNQKTYDEVYTLDKAEKDLLDGGRASDWVDGAESIYIWPTGGWGRVPLHRFFDGKYHFYTLGLDEGKGMKYDRLVGYVLPGPVKGSTEFYRWRRGK